MAEPRQIKTFSDLNFTERLYPHCIRCHKTGDALDAYKLTYRLGEDVPLTVIKKMLVCQYCGKKDGLILRLIPNETKRSLDEKAIG